MARLSNEFRFRVSAIHHATEAYLTPSLLKRFFGGAPSVAQFATHARYKWESWRGSEFAPIILADAGSESARRFGRIFGRVRRRGADSLRLPQSPTS